MVLFAMQSTASNAEPRIGVAASTKPNAEGVVGASSQTLSAGSELYTNETVRTGNLGQADLVFLDSTNLTVGPRSEVLLDKFVYDPTGSSGSVVLQATRGTFRFVTGTQHHRAYQLNTPYGTLGVRGTVVTFEIKEPKGKKKKPEEKGECAILVKVDQGKAEFTTTAKPGKPSKTYTINEGESLCLDEEGNAVATAEGPPPPSPPGPPAGGVTPPPCEAVSPTRPCP
jgi:FecR-like protein